ncbi:MAG: C-GCAxxG-C-C family protein [Eubacteriaceae bacterium]|nr:C-GCAxxG-C-C family protein [Eubacteriaceae bacterium]
MDKEERAVSMFASGYNCAQSVLAAFCEDYNLDTNTALMMANPLGGGARCGELCGALAGGLLVVGLECGFFAKGDLDQKRICNEKSYEYLHEFQKENGAVVCRELLGIDIRSNEDHMAADVLPTIKEKCPNFVACAVRLLEDLGY